MKSCSRCKEIKDLSNFHKAKNRADGHAPHCKACHKTTYPDRPWNKTKKGIKRKEYLLEVAGLFEITETKPFTGKFYFELFD